MKVPTYAADGRRIRDYSLEAIGRLARQRKVICTFGRRGQLLHATFLPHDGSKVMKTAHMGQRYSFPERVGDTRKAWRHAPMLNPNTLRSFSDRPMLAEDIDLFIRAIFRAVPLSCLRREPPRGPVHAVAGERVAA